MFSGQITKQSFANDPDVPSPTGYGWKLEEQDGDNILMIDWMEGKPAPQVLLDLLACTC